MRLSLGGGTDLPSYYREHEGFLIAAAIDRYVYITIHQMFQKQLILKYSKPGALRFDRRSETPILREALELVGVDDLSLEITSMADIPAGIGLGSSGASRLCATLAAWTDVHMVPDDVQKTGVADEVACPVNRCRRRASRRRAGLP